MQSTLGPVFSVGGGVDRPPGDLAEDFHEASKITRITHTGWTDVRFVQLLAAEASTGDRRGGGTGADEGPSGGLGEPTSAPGLLPARALAPRRPLHVPTSEAMERRRSAPATALGGSVSFADASDVLHYAYCERDDASRPCRFVPSGGALYPLDLYLVAAAVDGLPAGVYQLDPLRRALVNPFGHSGPDRIERFRRAAPSLMAPIAANASATIVVTASFERARYKYGLRGYRLSLLEAGHVVQNAALAASALGLRSLGWVGFVDHELDDLLDLDGVTQSSLYAFSFGGVRDEG
ncbi:SagB/ThcOx family dehydrogenase [Planctomonas deserti]|uniref:SagB/ThcOx family dehydrogenase n=1 Tax=Planctomonas deserti TaxID=2144185 RepID=UPI001F0B82C2|nr:SagB/ThcOx family dehydrogenase [Planctomonas deserti]